MDVSLELGNPQYDDGAVVLCGTVAGGEADGLPVTITLSPTPEGKTKARIEVDGRVSDECLQEIRDRVAAALHEAAGGEAT